MNNKYDKDALGIHPYIHQAHTGRECKPYFKQRSKSHAADAAGAVPWTVPDLCHAYDWPTGLVGGGIIAIVELGGGWVQSDMDAFFQSIGQPAPRILDVSVDGTRNNPNHNPINDDQHPNPDVEVALDIQVAAAAYFAATGKPAVIRVYWSADIAKAVVKATSDGCDVCSISWGSDEAKWGKGNADQMEAAATSATKAGMVVFAASGDNDSSDGGPTPANVDIPSSCPHVIGCGGTRKTPTSETVWNNDPGKSNGEGTGGGYSTIFPRPDFQTSAPAEKPGRMVPDVAANADPYTGYWMNVHGQRIAMGGTSAVAPLYAGLFAAFGKRLGFLTPKLWANEPCFNDIIEGDNGEYHAQPGPDPCTGLGSPIGSRLAALFVGMPAAAGAHAAMAESDAGSPVTVQARDVAATAGRIVGIDSLVPCSSDILTNAQSSKYLGQMPAFWGRYFYAPGQIDSSGKVDTHYSAAENGFLRQNGIRVLPVARQTGNVGGGAALAAADAAKNVAAIFEAFPPAYLSGADPEVLVFLDVEQDSPMTAAYYAAWSAAIIATSASLSNNRVRLHPAIYGSQSATATWAALIQAVGGGAVCDGAWIARYYYPSPVPTAWSDSLTTPAGGLPCPILGWQYWESPDHAPPAWNFDTTLVSPAHSDMLIGRLVMPPP